MAGRPAAVRVGGGGGGGMLYGLIGFAVVSVASLGAFIWQFTTNQQLADDAAAANRKLQTFGSPPSYYADEATARGSNVFGVMREDFEAVAQLVTGKAEAVRPAIEAESNRLLAEIAKATGEAVLPGDTLLTALGKLQRQFGLVRQELAQAKADLESLRTDNQNLSNGIEAARKEFQEQIGQLEAELARVRTESGETLAAKDEQLTNQSAAADAVTEEFSRFRVERQQADRRSEIETERLRRTIADLQSKIEELRPAGFDVNDILTKADGRVLRAIPGSDVVYINLGERDAMRPGLRFVVFSPFSDRGVDYRGKALLEVNTAMTDTSECKVVSTTGIQPIVEGDIIVNIAYEQGRKPKFVIRGEFDLNYDGQTDWDGVEQITARIREWGGQVAADLDETTDFVVIGRGPQVAPIAGDRAASPVVRDLVQGQQEARDEFYDLIERAKTLYIPTINQQQFLYLTGSSLAGGLSFR